MSYSAGGTIHAASEGLGKGATFTVALPIARGSAVLPDELREKAAGGRLTPKNPPSLAGVRALFVDDDVDARKLTTMMLEECGAEVRTVGSAAEALAACDEWRPDILIADIGMPVEDGYMLMKKLRALESERGGHIPAIALTADTPSPLSRRQTVTSRAAIRIDRVSLSLQNQQFSERRALGAHVAGQLTSICIHPIPHKSISSCSHTPAEGDRLRGLPSPSLYWRIGALRQMVVSCIFSVVAPVYLCPALIHSPGGYKPWVLICGNPFDC